MYSLALRVMLYNKDRRGIKTMGTDKRVIYLKKKQ